MPPASGSAKFFSGSAAVMGILQKLIANTGILRWGNDNSSIIYVSYELYRMYNATTRKCAFAESLLVVLERLWW